MITIEVDDANVLRVIAELQRRMADMQPAMQSVGEYLVESTHRRFSTSTAPDGSRWAPNSQVTYLRMLESRGGTSYTKGERAGRINAKGAGVAMTKKPLIGETHRLENEIVPFASQDGVEVGSNLIYAAVQQFGAKMGEFGRYSQVSRWRKFGDKDFRKYAGTVKGFPIPWGDIPARPFLGLSTDDADNVLSIVGRFLAAASD